MYNSDGALCVDGIYQESTALFKIGGWETFADVQIRDRRLERLFYLMRTFQTPSDSIVL
jgi:hypothetical protein